MLKKKEIIKILNRVNHLVENKELKEIITEVKTKNEFYDGKSLINVENKSN